MILDKIQYSFIYSSYKAYRVKHRKGRGYQYIKYTDAAHRTIGILFSLTLFFVSAIITGRVSGGSTNVIVGICAIIISSVYLDFSVSKKKMLRYRFVYKDAKKYMLYYFLFLAGLLAAAFIYKCFT